MKSQYVRHVQARRAISHPAKPRRRGFTLTELLVVIGIIVLVVTIAVPAFNTISGNRSIDAAQNQLAAIIGRARQEAIGLQQNYGVILFQDPNTGRACAAVVNIPDPLNPMILGLAPNHDELLLPTGVSFRMIETAPPKNGPAAYYCSMNVLMFNSRGEAVFTPWGVLQNPLPAPWTGTGPNPNAAPNAESVALGARILPMPSFTNINMLQPLQESYTYNALVVQPGSIKTVPIKTTIWVDPGYVAKTSSTPGATYGTSAFGFVLFPDEGAYRNAFDVSNGTTSYLTDNGMTFLINKYNGTLLRTE